MISKQLKEIEQLTIHLNSSELRKAHFDGLLPTGIYDFLSAIRAADIAIKPKNVSQTGH